MVRYSLAGAVIVTFALLSGMASSQPRIESRQMTCDAAKRLVAAQGAVLFSLGPSVYERIVRDDGFCMLGEAVYVHPIPTRDNPQCSAGLYCGNKKGLSK